MPPPIHAPCHIVFIALPRADWRPFGCGVSEWGLQAKPPPSAAAQRGDDGAGAAVFERYTSKYCWNTWLLQPFYDAGLSGWCPIVVQGVTCHSKHAMGDGADAAAAAPNGQTTPALSTLSVLFLSKRLLSETSPASAARPESGSRSVLCELIMWMTDCEIGLAQESKALQWASYTWFHGDHPEYLDLLGGGHRTLEPGTPRLQNDAVELALLYCQDLIGSVPFTFVNLYTRDSSVPANRPDSPDGDEAPPPRSSGSGSMTASGGSWHDEDMFGLTLPDDDEDAVFDRADDIDSQARSPIGHFHSSSSDRRSLRASLYGLLGGPKSPRRGPGGPGGTGRAGSKTMRMRQELAATNKTVSSSSLTSLPSMPAWLMECERKTSSGQELGRSALGPLAAPAPDPWHCRGNVSMVSYDWDAQVSTRGIPDAVLGLWASVRSSIRSYGVGFGAFRDDGQVSIAESQTGYFHFTYENDVRQSTPGNYYTVMQAMVAMLSRMSMLPSGALGVGSSLEQIEYDIFNIYYYFGPTAYFSALSQPFSTPQRAPCAVFLSVPMLIECCWYFFFF